MALAPVRLQPSFREKVWGTTRLSPWFPDSDRNVGEVWFSGPGNDFPILLKFLFTSDRLSVQVHPDDAYAIPRERSPGKTEMWHILRADPGASIALGFKKPYSATEVRDACLTGAVVEMLEWMPVAPGDTYFTPPGTVHAIGAGIALCEIQQNSDLTYRLYDYGRPRELHLDKALAVASLGPHPGKSRPDGTLLASCPYFATESLDLSVTQDYAPDPARFHMLAVLSGSGILGTDPFSPGEVWLIPAGAAGFRIDPKELVRMLRTYVP
jgi:mannose-6-phosphate isomerase